jgi:TonB family protein
MKNYLFITVFILVSRFVYCQSPEAAKNYEKGTEALDSKNYKEAISFLTLSIDEFPSTNAYYNRAFANYYIGDSCGFCFDLKNAANLNDTEALELYKKHCKHSRIEYNVPDSLMFADNKITHLEIITTSCGHDSTIYVYRKVNGNVIREELMEVFGKGQVFTIVEEMPSYPGGENARNRFLAENIFYPKTATNYGIQGTVYVQFILDRNGSVTEAKISRGIGGGCDEEALRVVNMMPKWIPGRQNGKTVRVMFIMPIYFKLKG